MAERKFKAGDVARTLVAEYDLPVGTLVTLLGDDGEPEDRAPYYTEFGRYYHASELELAASPPAPPVDYFAKFTAFVEDHFAQGAPEDADDEATVDLLERISRKVFAVNIIENPTKFIFEPIKE